MDGAAFCFFVFLGVHADCADAASALLAALDGRPITGSDQSGLVAERRAAFERETAHLEPQRSILAAIDGVMINGRLFDGETLAERYPNQREIAPLWWWDAEPTDVPGVRPNR